MSESTTPTDPKNASTMAPLPKRRNKKSIHDKDKLPTPPPDPKQIKNERDVFEYLENLIPNYPRSTASFAPAIATDEAFDHLEQLYKLMEQMLELKEQNAKLHRKVRDLEHFNNLAKMHRQLETIGVDKDYPELDRDTTFAETILESILSDFSKKDPKKTLSPAKQGHSILRKQRNRSNSAIEKQVTLDASSIAQHEQDYEPREKNSKVSKWTKVKAAFRWEKASTSMGETKSQDSGIHVPVNLEIARYLMVPSTSDDAGHSPADSGAAGISTPGSLSTTSSTEDFRRSELRAHFEDMRSVSDDDTQNYIPNLKGDSSPTKSLPKSPRTPWAKMKDIIQTRNSFKKKHRLSAASDDIQIDVELCSDNEDVFEDDFKRKSFRTSETPSPNCSSRYIRADSTDVPQEVIDRYQKALIEDCDKKISKWVKVKKAFLNQENFGGAKEKDSDAEDEIQRHYRKLQKKLSLEFQEKHSEWERMKQNSPGVSNPSSSCGFVEDNRDANFIKKMEEWQKIKGQQNKSPMPSEFDLPPEFKKKLQEWEKIKKSSAKESSGAKKKLADVPRWKSLSGHRSETSTAFEYPDISNDFRKKLEEWNQIKSSSSAESGHRKLKDKTPSPKLSRKNSLPKFKKDKELHWYEKELSKVKKEKQRLERERQKFIEREERLSKLRKSVVGANKKEVLVHTPSGFYRFQGISRKFTRKLYKWEKAQGIGPEESTIALLSSSNTPEIRLPIKRQTTGINISSLVRSKSADSIAISTLNLTRPLMTQLPSSLSLNDVEELEKECLSESKCSSINYLLESEDVLDLDEPEALLVEVEDYEEETAAPLRTIVQRQQLPIYQRQGVKALCEGETVAAPKVRRSESARAQTNYNLIEDIVNILRQMAENEIEVKNFAQFGFKETQFIKNRNKLKTIYDTQKHLSSRMLEKLQRLLEENSSVATSITKEGYNNHQGHLADLLEAVLDVSNEILQMAEKMDQNTSKRSEAASTTYTSYLTMFENIRDIRTKLLELRRHLSYVCAATDLTAPNRKISSSKKTIIHKSLSSDSKSSRYDTSDLSRVGSHKESKHYIKSENASTSSQGAVKKRIKYRQKLVQSKSNIDTDEEDNNAGNEEKKNRHKKLTRTRTFSESKDEVKEQEGIEYQCQKVLVPTEMNSINTSYGAYNQDDTKSAKESPLEVFVKTTKKMFTPIVETSQPNTLENKQQLEKELPKIQIKSLISTNKNEKSNESVTKDEEILEELKETITPLPLSPNVQKKVLKDISPSIRLMLAKYNQKISEQDGSSIKSGNSSGSNSPIAWRSPTSERRVKAQTERYLEEVNKLSPLLGQRREVRKSASVGILHAGNKQVTVPFRRDSIQENMVTTSQSNDQGKEDAMQNKEVSFQNEEVSLQSKEAVRKSLTLDLKLTNECPTSSKHSPEIRLKKLQKAKEEFLKTSPVTAPAELANNDALKFPTRNRLSQISVDSESSYDSSLPGALTKCASAGMINVDPHTYRQIDPELHGGGYVSLPRNSKSPKAGKFALSNIAAKFRKVKMRKGKVKDKMNAVSVLCRQSLVVDISQETTENCQNAGRDVRSPVPFVPDEREETRRRLSSPTPSTSRSNSWLKISLFKK